MLGEVGGDGAVVGACAGENLEGQLLAKGLEGRFVIHRGQDAGIVRRIAHHRHALVVLGGAPQHARAADVDILDRLLELHILLGHRGLEGIEIDDHKVDHRDAVLGGLRHVLRLVAAAEEPAVNLRVQRLHAALHHLRESRVFRHVGHGKTLVAQELRGAAGGEQLEAVVLYEAGREIGKAGFVADGKKCELFHPLFQKPERVLCKPSFTLPAFAALRMMRVPHNVGKW